jgi:GDP-L-fucose synthase
LVGTFLFEASNPDGTPRKLLDVSRLHALGWKASIGLEKGLRNTYAWFLDNLEQIRA